MKRMTVYLVLFALACSSRMPLTMQPGPGGTITGIVTTADGVPLPGATVTIDADGHVRTSITGANGSFLFAGLVPATYRVTAELSGLRPVTLMARVTAMEGVQFRPVLQPASVSEAITVTAQAPPMNAPGATIHPQNAPAVAYKRTGAVLPPPIELPNANPQYAAIAEHGFVDTAKERVTTFAIDVDTASYTNVRRYLAAGQRPPADAVRIEELLNYFRYDDARPAGSVPFSVTTEVAGCPWNAQNRVVRIGIQGMELDRWKMAPNNLVFLLDVSGSMSTPESLPLLQSAFRVLVDELRAEDRVAIVVYAGAAGLVLPPTSDKAAIRQAIGRLQAGGSTAGGAGIELAYKVAAEQFLANGNNRVILATDGDFNVGVSDLEGLQQLIEAKRKTGVFLSVLGVGTANFQDAMMETLADKGNGNYAYLDSLKEAEKVFRRDLTGTLVTIAKDVKVQVEFDPQSVASYRQIGYENRALSNKDFADDAKDAGELGAGHHVTALYEIVPTATAARGTIGAIRLRYKAPNGETSTPLDATIVDEGKSAWDASPDMQLATAVAEFGMLLRDSPYKGSATWDDVAHHARLAIGADLDGTREEFARLVESGRLLANPNVTRK